MSSDELSLLLLGWTRETWPELEGGSGVLDGFSGTLAGTEGASVAKATGLSTGGSGGPRLLSGEEKARVPADCSWVASGDKGIPNLEYNS